MDPIAHTLTGAALAASGLRRATPLATAALLIGANAPDIDVLANFTGQYSALAFRRGWTHGVLAIVVLPFVVAGLLLLWDRWVRRSRNPSVERARAGPLLGVAALAVITHPTLDWLNNYGMRWLMPFDGRWFYGDALFIIDPWVWLTLGGVLYGAYSARTISIAAWWCFWLAATVLMFTTELVPVAARVVWSAGLALVVTARAVGYLNPARANRAEHAARVGVLLVAFYMTVAALANIPARAAVRADLAARGIDSVQRVMVSPVAANPFAGEVVVETPSEYLLGRWHWLAEPRFALEDEAIPRRASDGVVAAASRTPEVERFLVWSRFPYFEVESTANGYRVNVRDARYRDTGRLLGPTVLLDKNLEPLRH